MDVGGGCIELEYGHLMICFSIVSNILLFNILSTYLPLFAYVRTRTQHTQKHTHSHTHKPKVFSFLFIFIELKICIHIYFIKKVEDLCASTYICIYKYIFTYIANIAALFVHRKINCSRNEK